MKWSDEFFDQLRGEGCHFCAEGRPEETDWGVRFFAGHVADAYLARADIQRGLTAVVWRGRHVVEPIELTDLEAARYGREVLVVTRAIVTAFAPIKMNYDVLGNSVPHLHTHLVPRYVDDPRPGWPFPFPDPEPGPMPPEQFARDLHRLQAALAAGPVSLAGRSRRGPGVRGGR